MHPCTERACAQGKSNMNLSELRHRYRTYVSVGSISMVEIDMSVATQCGVQFHNFPHHPLW